MGVSTARDASAFRAFRTSLRKGFEAYRSPAVSIDVLLTWSTTRFTAIKVRHEPRVAGTSGYTFRKLVRHALDLMTGFSVLPLRAASIVGFASLLFGLLILLVVTINWIVRGSAVPGFAFLASITTIFSGGQLFALGIIGEYLGRIHTRSMDRPVYLVGEVTDPPAPESDDAI
jgi:undecaprenyl-phosphate 4-deoxy-4-formamido-L-arabinose transferase